MKVACISKCVMDMVVNSTFTVLKPKEVQVIQVFFRERVSKVDVGFEM